ncbi:hypothetical protein KXJ69_13465 [Aureisphaera sp. CAU 1614]|uniref:Intradiol ring-cleavage dioxygenases domain-containing protein n=1 Tax=Halomarinibacterium sedimenti TaxID=2857106 RepID=A0A9X1FS73_9FLAO|nr:hypothetical protein [Halomarinibacterium sedimenti]MBW2939119.1 hypothetical protein [Halomarinibacterium sedimenti]HAT63645.1 hypothetical protein [Flavobacteriaceae bacterium]|tara:strand:+ start:2437 stop:3009 length:573 start_codon:yes stop_codon:yes gene_type:complete
MKENISRRIFIRKSAVATTGLALVASSTPLLAFSESNSPYKGYNPFAEEKNDLRTNPFGKHIAVSGKIFSSDGETILPNTSVEVWHLSPDSKKFRHNAKIKTNESGEYYFITDLPYKEKNVPRNIFFKVTNNSESYFTKLYILSNTAYFNSQHWEENQNLGKHLATLSESTNTQMSIQFNISLTNQTLKN